MKSELITIIIAEATRTKKGRAEVVEAPGEKSAPHYFKKTIPQQFILERGPITLKDAKGELLLKTYPRGILLLEAHFDIPDIFAENVINFKEEALNYCYEFLKKKGAKDVEEFSEEYSVYVVSNYTGDPEQFLKYKNQMAALLKSEKLTLDEKEVEYTLSSQIKYAKNDLVIVEWDGAFIFDPEGNVAMTLELIELANFQLLRYRVLDKELDLRLDRVAKLIEHSPLKTNLFTARDVKEALKETMLTRSRSISEFQLLEREIKLIGDWYSAKLYDLMVKKFKLDEWRKTIKDKLDAIEGVYKVASENFTVSWESRGRILELIGWYVLLLGYLILLVLDIYFFKK